MKLYLSIISTFVSFLGIAQQNVQYPDFLRAWNQVEVLSNPAALQHDSIVFEATLIQKSRMGPLKNIGFKIGVGEWYVRKKNSTHSFKGIAFSETEGPYISRSRWYGNYAYQLTLANELSASLGVNYGYVQNKYDAVTVLNGNSGVSDGGVGFKLQFKALEIGASSLQLFNNAILTGEKVTLELSRYYTFTTSYALECNELFQLTPSIYYRLLPQGVNNVLLSLELEYNYNYAIGMVGEVHKGMAFYVQSSQLFTELPVSFLFLYRTSIFSNLPAQFNHVEMGLGYRFNR